MEEKRDSLITKCPSCGGNMVFDPETQSLKCEYCGTVQTFEQCHNVKEEDILQGFENSVQQWNDDNMTCRCSNCGATVVLRKTDVATLCPYCSTGHVVQIEDDFGIKPKAIYPFQITKDKCLELAKENVKHSFFAPSKFKKSFNADNIRPAYEPAYTFDSHSYSRYVGELGEDEKITERHGDRVEEKTITHWYKISGTCDIFFDDVMVNGSPSISQAVFDRISPFDYQSIKTYDPKFLSGYPARKTEKDIKTGWKEAKAIMAARIKRKILSQYHYDRVRYLNITTSHEKVTYKYILYPLYYLLYTYGKKKRDPIYINGNTGKVYGKKPVSALRVLGLILSILAVIAIGVVIYVLSKQGNGGLL